MAGGVHAEEATVPMRLRAVDVTRGDPLGRVRVPAGDRPSFRHEPMRLLNDEDRDISRYPCRRSPDRTLSAEPAIHPHRAWLSKQPFAIPAVC